MRHKRSFRRSWTTRPLRDSLSITVSVLVVKLQEAVQAIKDATGSGYGFILVQWCIRVYLEVLRFAEFFRQLRHHKEDAESCFTSHEMYEVLVMPMRSSRSSSRRKTLRRICSNLPRRIRRPSTGRSLWHVQWRTGQSRCAV